MPFTKVVPPATVELIRSELDPLRCGAEPEGRQVSFKSEPGERLRAECCRDLFPLLRGEELSPGQKAVLPRHLDELCGLVEIVLGKSGQKVPPSGLQDRLEPGPIEDEHESLLDPDATGRIGVAQARRVDARGEE